MIAVILVVLGQDDQEFKCWKFVQVWVHSTAVEKTGLTPQQWSNEIDNCLDTLHPNAAARMCAFMRRQDKLQLLSNHIAKCDTKRWKNIDGIISLQK